MEARRIALAAAAVAAMGAQAAGAGYFGLTVGASTVEDWDDVGFALSDGSFSSPHSESGDTAFRVFGGLGMTETVALEFAYADFGEATFDAQSNGCCFYPPGPVAVAMSSTGMEFSVVGRGAVSATFAVIGRLGLMRWETEVDVRIGPDAGSDSTDGTDLFYGFGVEYRLSPMLGLRGEVVRYSLEDVDIDSFSLSLAIRGGGMP